MIFTSRPGTLEQIAPMRELFRSEMNCQIIHDSLHARPGWTESLLVEANGEPCGYGSVAVGGPWKESRTVFEFFVLPNHRTHVFSLFDTFLAACGATAMEIQTNDRLLDTLFHLHVHDVEVDKILFEDKFTTLLIVPGALLRPRPEPDNDWALEINGAVAATGGVLYHYNRPYGDIYMEVVETFRQRGLGSYLVQELKRICREGGNTPAARCNPKNIASRRTLQKAGFAPCGLILVGKL